MKEAVAAGFEDLRAARAALERGDIPRLIRKERRVFAEGREEIAEPADMQEADILGNHLQFPRRLREVRRMGIDVVHGVVVVVAGGHTKRYPRRGNFLIALDRLGNLDRADLIRRIEMLAKERVVDSTDPHRFVFRVDRLTRVLPGIADRSEKRDLAAFGNRIRSNPLHLLDVELRRVDREAMRLLMREVDVVLGVRNHGDRKRPAVLGIAHRHERAACGEHHHPCRRRGGGPTQFTSSHQHRSPPRHGHTRPKSKTSQTPIHESTVAILLNFGTLPVNC